jgi:UDP-N-acetylmuramyl pentapeptide phosphotransferase/UDP-N-acetylglucosamine-1-phosphate transferase
MSDGLRACANASLVALLAATMVLSAALTWLAIRYALHRQLLDLPGRRRSHETPTPRGGGIAIVVAMLAGFGILLASCSSRSVEYLLLLMPPVIGIALVGWLDDHGGLSTLKRFAMHCVAAAWVFGAPLLYFVFFGDGAAGGVGLAVFAGLAVTVAIVWSINLHNFMDGINGLLSLQAVFVFSVLAGLFMLREQDGSAALLVCAAACAGFVPFNFPRARVFMGDVGSGVLGFVIAVAVLWQIGTPRIAAASGLVLCSAFVADATCTLLWRMIGGRRWYSAHREHLYQWLVRCGYSHAHVVALYMGWNLLIVLPVVYWMNRTPAPAGDPGAAAAPSMGIGVAVAVYSLAIVLWWLGKRRCLTVVAMRRLHAAA